MPIIQLPNGQTAEFPDDMDPAEIESVLAQSFPAQPQGVDNHTATKSNPSYVVPAVKLPGWKEAYMMAAQPQLDFMKNVVTGGYNVVQGAANIMMDPIPAAQGMGTLVQGLSRAAFPSGVFKPGEVPAGWQFSQEQKDRADAAAAPIVNSLKTAFANPAGIPGRVAKYSFEHPVEQALNLTSIPGVRSLTGKMAPSLRLGREATAAEVKIAEAFAKEGLPVKPSSIMENSKLAQGIKSGSNSLIAGRLNAANAAEKVETGVIKMFEDQKNLIPVSPDISRGAIGENFGSAVMQEGKNLRKAIKPKYETLSEYLGGTKKMYKMDNTVKVLKENHDLFKGTPTENIVGEILDKVSRVKSKGRISGAEVDKLQSVAWKGTFKNDPRVGGDLANAMTKDLEIADPKILEAWKSAKDSNTLWHNYESNPIVQGIKKRYKSSSPDKILSYAFQTGKMEDIQLIRKSVPKPVFDEAMGKVVQDIFDKGIGSRKGQRFFDGNAFVKEYQKYRRQIQSVRPDIAENMDQFVNIGRAAQRDIASAKITAKEQLAHGVVSGLGLFGTGGWFLVPQGFSYAVSRSMTKPSGWVKQWLMSGGKIPTAPLKIAGKSIKIGNIPNQLLNQESEE
jgi:hypothetical protein